MKRADLHFSYPEELVAVEPKRPSRVMWVEGGKASEISIASLKDKFQAGDVLVINETRVLPRRVFAGELEILFLNEVEPNLWQVLFPSAKFKVNHEFDLPGHVKMTLVEKGRPQFVRVSSQLDSRYFETHGELPLPPYIQKARAERHNQASDPEWYQTAWSAVPGSMAAPTASLHFSLADLADLRSRGVAIHKLVLHVGLGTFLPVTSENLEEHQMHKEFIEISRSTWAAVDQAQLNDRRIWALGTTVARSLESAARGLLNETPQGFVGESDLFLYPGADWKVVNRLLTNFHQPESTLLALVASFCDLQTVQSTYQWAIDKKFRLFSYGDLSAWTR